MKITNLIIAYFATVMAASSATVIGINFALHSSGVPDGGGAQAGGNSFGAEWTDILSTTGSGVTLNGTSATLDFGFSGTPQYWLAGSWTGTEGGNSEISVFRNYLNDNGVTVTLNGLDDWLTNEGLTAYTLTLYLSSDGGTAFHTATVGGNPLPVPILGNGTWNGSLEDPLGDSTQGIRGQATTGALTGDSLTFSIPAWNDPNNPPGARGGLAAIVITAVPEPATAGLAAIGALAFLRRRRD